MRFFGIEKAISFCCWVSHLEVVRRFGRGSVTKENGEVRDLRAAGAAYEIAKLCLPAVVTGATHSAWQRRLCKTERVCAMRTFRIRIWKSFH